MSGDERATWISIDVILPVYNGAEFVTRALDSVLAQEPHNELGGWHLNIHLIDDASTDDSNRILGEFAARVNDANITVSLTTRETNEGVAHARNLGISLGSSPYVAFIDQDDEWVPDKLARQISALNADETFGYAVGKQQLRVQPGHTRPAWCRPEWLAEPLTGFVPSTLVVRRSSFEKLGVFDTSLGNGFDDTDWFARARTASVPYFDAPSCVVFRYAHDANASSDIAGSNLAMLDVVRRHLARNTAP
jgi:glycosyltransferase involved in cell wall biosynthesis